MTAQQNPTADPKGPVMTFDSTEYHFGKVHEGEIVTHEFHFTNTGKSPLIISSCMSACGCDVATGPKESIPPGGSGIIKYELMTESRTGMQSKTVTITYYPDQAIVLHIYGEIIPSTSAK